MRLHNLVLVLITALFFAGCKVYKTLPLDRPTVCIPEEYAGKQGQGEAMVAEWWRQFENQDLNDLVENALTGNLNLRASWWKVAEACAQARIVGAAKYPEITSTPSVLHFRNSGSGSFGAGIGGTGAFGSNNIDVVGGAGTVAQDSVTFYLLTNSLSYEVDLWRRIDSLTKAACYEVQATREDLESTAWLLTGTVTDLWFTIQEQKTLLDVIDHQIEVSKTQLELIELRFSVSQSSALDVFQQRLQLAQTISERPPVQSLLETSLNQMNVLLGIPPEKYTGVASQIFSDLPPFPEIGRPIELLCNRPDLRSEQRRLRESDYEVAAAVADLFPRLDLSINYDFQAMRIKELFEEKTSQIIGSLFTPIFDGGRRRAEVQRRKAIVCQRLNSYGQKFLDALLEVEDALVQERLQNKLIDIINQELEIAKTNLDEAKWHYINGLNDYLTVISAIQSLQNLERRVVSEKKQLLLYRSKLYRALGGPYITSRCL